MAQWQILKGNVVQPEPWFDDGILAKPGEDGFTTDYAAAEAKRLKCDGFSYVGNSTAVSERNVATVDELASAMADAALEEIKQAHGDDVVEQYRDEVAARARDTVLRDLGLSEA